MAELPRPSYRDWPGSEHFVRTELAPAPVGFDFQLAPPTVANLEGINLATIVVFNGGEQTRVWLREDELAQLVVAASSTLDAMRDRSWRPEWKDAVATALAEARARREL
jgi:hypothetical protein